MDKNSLDLTLTPHLLMKEQRKNHFTNVEKRESKTGAVDRRHSNAFSFTIHCCISDNGFVTFTLTLIIFSVIPDFCITL